MRVPMSHRRSMVLAAPILLSVLLAACRGVPGSGTAITPAPTLPTAEPPQPSSTSTPPKPTVQPPSPTPESRFPSGYRPIKQLDPESQLELTTVDMIDDLIGWSMARFS